MTENSALRASFDRLAFGETEKARLSNDLVYPIGEP